MKNSIILVFIFFISPLFGQKTEEFFKRMQAQIRESCRTSWVVDKSVTDLSTWQTETHRFQQDTSAKWLTKELQYAWNVLAFSPRIKDYFAISYEEKGSIAYYTATILPAYSEKTPLQYQKIVYNVSSGNIISWESRQESKSLLSESEVKICVYFDSKGEYLYHILKLYSSIPLIGQRVHHFIHGSNKGATAK